MITQDDLWNAVTTSQACQRNWDLDRKIPQDHMDLMIHAATQAPTKQNYSYFDLYVITDREKIKTITDLTLGATITNTKTREKKLVTNVQAGANALFVFDYKTLSQMSEDYQDDQEVKEHDNWEQFKKANESTLRIFYMDANRAIGICSGQLALVSNLLGYRTGYCQCFDDDLIKAELNTRGHFMLLLGVGFPDENKPRLEHPDLSGWNFMKKRREETRVVKL